MRYIEVLLAQAIIYLDLSYSWINNYMDTSRGCTSPCSAGNNFSLFTEHMLFQIFLSVGHFTNLTGHNVLTDNTTKKLCS